MFDELKLIATMEPWFPLRALMMAFSLHRLRAIPLLVRKLVTPRPPLPSSDEVGPVDERDDPGVAWCAAIPLLCDNFADELNWSFDLHRRLEFRWLELLRCEDELNFSVLLHDEFDLLCELELNDEELLHEECL